LIFSRIFIVSGLSKHCQVHARNLSFWVNKLLLYLLYMEILVSIQRNLKVPFCGYYQVLAIFKPFFFANTVQYFITAVLAIELLCFPQSFFHDSRACWETKKILLRHYLSFWVLCVLIMRRSNDRAHIR